jgi:hypothetical protein
MWYNINLGELITTIKPAMGVSKTLKRRALTNPTFRSLPQKANTKARIKYVTIPNIIIQMYKSKE